LKTIFEYPDPLPPLSLQMAAVVTGAPEEPRPAAQGLIDGVLREMPASFLCPLSKEVMTDPVLLVASGQTYERAALAKRFAMQRLLTRPPTSSRPATSFTPAVSKRTKDLLALLKRLQTSKTCTEPSPVTNVAEPSPPTDVSESSHVANPVTTVTEPSPAGDIIEPSPETNDTEPSAEETAVFEPWPRETYGSKRSPVTSRVTSLTEPVTRQTLTNEQASLLVDNVALREAIKHFFTRSAAKLKVRGGRRLGEEMHEGVGATDHPVTLICSLPWPQETRVATVEVMFWDRAEHLPITMTWEDYLKKREMSNVSHLTFYDEATGRDLTRGATLEAMGYRGGTLVVSRR
jgi:hypothetical protein